MIVPEPHELQELVRDLHQRNSPWLPAGLGSRLHWGPPVTPCPVVSTAALGGIREYSPGDFTLTVGAGTPLADIQAALAPHGQWLALDAPFQDSPATADPVDPAAADPAGPASAAPPGRSGGSIGGLVARGLAGGYRERYLGVRDQVIGIRLLRSDGVEARAGGKVVKNVAGYDLMRLLCGSWGSLALITELTLRTMPLPGARGGVLLSAPLPALMALRGRLLASGLTPERLDLWHAPLATATGVAAEPVLLVALASVNQASLEAQLQAVENLAPGLSRRRCGAEELLELLARAYRSPSDVGWLLRLAVLPSRLDTLLQRPELAEVPVNLAAGSGIGLAWAPAPFAAAQVLALRRCCGELGGHLTVLRQPASADPPEARGAASPPTPAVPAWEDAPSRPLIEAIKARFDPGLQLAPGRLPGVSRPPQPRPATPA